MAETVVYTPEQNQANSLLPYALMGGNGGFGGFGGGWGGGILGFFLGLLFGNGWGGFGNGFGGGWGGNSGAGFLSNQINNDSGRELLMNAITSQGEAGRAATQNLATMLGQDFNLVNSAIATLQSGLSTLAMQQAVSVPQIINSIQAGDASLTAKLQECCCENRLLTTEQGYQAQIRTIEQTNQLGSQADRNTASVVGAINGLHTDMTREFCAVKEREMQAEINRQAEIITQLRNEADNARQTSAIAAMLAPIQTEVAAIKAAQPPTVAVPYPQLQAIPSFNTIELLANIGILNHLVNGGSTSTTTSGSTTA